jgi:hypothetical protein
MAHRISRKFIIIILGFVLSLILACDGFGKSRQDLQQEMQQTEISRMYTQTHQAIPTLVYPLFFFGTGTHTQQCTQNAEITFFVPDGNSCRVSVEYPAACNGPLAEIMGTSITFRGTVTDGGSQPSYCEITTCPSGEASGTVYFKQTEMVNESTPNCPGSDSIVEFGPLERQEGSAEP